MNRRRETLVFEHPAQALSGRPTAEEWIETFHAQLKERGLKSTAQRDEIAQAFYRMGRHISAEELYGEVKQANPHVGYATIYRTLKLLKECELVSERHFDEGQARYEVLGERHHDHFICERCGRIIEFENPQIERLQQAIAQEIGASLTRHKVELYGLCRDCRGGVNK
jgi:Fur family ferric uptake transcriptional regulator